MTVSITSIIALPSSPYQGTGTIGIVITSGVSSYFKITGYELDKIVDVNWYPTNLSSVDFIIRDVILLNPTLGTFMVEVTDNFSDITDRGGKISFRTDSGNTISFPVKTYGPMSLQSFWRGPYDGLPS